MTRLIRSLSRRVWSKKVSSHPTTGTAGRARHDWPSGGATEKGDELAKTNPSKINYGSSLNGSIPHLAGEMFKTMAGVDMAIVPYRGTSPMLTDLLGGQLQVAIAEIPASMPHIRTGSLRALAVTTAERLSALPGIPTVGEFVPGFEASTWQGIGAPRNTPADVIDKLNQAINAGLASPVINARLADLGMSVLRGSPADFGKLIADETEKWGKVIRAANIKPE
jgi:tripartite-type tricarboxylate transporter receptor subunit TctC